MEIKKAAKDLYLIPISHNCLVQVLEIQKHQRTFAQIETQIKKAA